MYQWWICCLVVFPLRGAHCAHRPINRVITKKQAATVLSKVERGNDRRIISVCGSMCGKLGEQVLIYLCKNC